MSEISYVFMPMPFEFMNRNFFEDPIMMCFIDWMMRRISPNSSVVPLKEKQLSLAPYEFMFGRVACALAAGISVKNARTRLKRLIGLGYVKKVAGKGSSTYSVYSLETGAFRQIVKSQESGQQLGQKKGHRTGHNLETKNKDLRKKKETF